VELRRDEPIGRATVDAIHQGNVDALKHLVHQHSGLASARIGGEPGTCHADKMSRTLLHVATDWPGHFPNVPATVALLIDAGADVNARFIGPHTETPLHWAASSDDIDVIDVLLDRGADIEAPGSVIGGGTPLADAVAFGQWNAARRLIERGAQSTLWQSAALGLMDRVTGAFAPNSPPTAEDVTTAFWCACHGGQRLSAEYLLDRGADISWIGFDKLTALDAARRSGAEELAGWLVTRGAKSAKQDK
jgi:ankyrin repeat protein